jgi:O-antigen/teichoic acid export membrane protein
MKDAPADRPPGVGGDRISRNATFAFAAQMSTAAFTAALTIFLTRELGPAGYGVFALALSFTGLLRRPAAGGTSQAAARFVAERLGNLAAVTGVLGMALRIRLLSAGAIAAALFALAGPIAELYDTPEMAWPLRAVSIAFIGQSLMNFWNNIFVASRRASSSFALISSEAAMEFTASVALVLLGGGVLGAAFGRAIGYLFGAALGVFLVARLLGRSPLRRTGRSPVTRREFVGYSGVMLIVTSATTAFAQLDVLVIGAFLTASAVGIYSAPLRLVGFLAYPGQALAQGVAPRLARHPDEAPAVRAAERALRYMVMFQAGLVAVLLVWAEPFVRLVLGTQFLESAEVLRALTPYVFLNGMSALLVSPLNYAGEGRRRIPVAVATLVVAIGIDVILIPEIGILGAAVGTDVAFALYIGGHLWLCHRVLGLPLGSLAATAIRALAAAAGLAGILIAVGTEQLSALQWLGGLAGGGAVFVAILVVTRAVSIDELRSLAALPRSALRRGSR